MKALRIAVCIAALCIVGAIAWYWTAYPTYVHRYRLTVTAQVNDRMQSASSVIEVKWIAQPENLFAGIPFRPEVLGDAVYLDLSGRPLVVTLWADTARLRESRNASELALHAFGLKRNRDGLANMSLVRGKEFVPVEALPLLITFDDNNTPDSIRAVGPDEFAHVFGPGIGLQSASIEITNDPVDRTIQAKLPWLKGMKRSTLIGKLEGGRHPFFYAISLTGEDG